VVLLVICAFGFGFAGVYLVLAAFIPVLRFKEWSWGHYARLKALGGVDSPIYRKAVEPRAASNRSYGFAGATCLLLMVPFLSGLNPTFVPHEIGILALIASPFPLFIAAVTDAAEPKEK
jgi:hypothetical protein